MTPLFPCSFSLAQQQLAPPSLAVQLLGETPLFLQPRRPSPCAQPSDPKTAALRRAPSLAPFRCAQGARRNVQQP
ncbi:hypothetical protein Zm00014a_021394 [Zea mays]|uniref:Uncharacterized protein n=1 Tax=Zea mays TaxID=4577 RepID=A0A3L6ET68_MAIZE|nr:hypothetical protein Zm00014a_021394 [Zea mays]